MKKPTNRTRDRPGTGATTRWQEYPQRWNHNLCTASFAYIHKCKRINLYTHLNLTWIYIGKDCLDNWNHIRARASWWWHVILSLHLDSSGATNLNNSLIVSVLMSLSYSSNTSKVFRPKMGGGVARNVPWKPTTGRKSAWGVGRRKDKVVIINIIIIIIIIIIVIIINILILMTGSISKP